MNISLTQACHVMASLQARVDHCAMQAYRANSAARGANLRPGTPPSPEVVQAADNWTGALLDVTRDLEGARPEFGALLSTLPAANDALIENGPEVA